MIRHKNKRNVTLLNDENLILTEYHVNKGNIIKIGKIIVKGGGNGPINFTDVSKKKCN